VMDRKVLQELYERAVKSVAERVAVFKGVSEGYRKLLALSLVAVKDGETLPVLPCGACRQVMWEFGNGDTPVYDGEKVY